MIQRIQTVFLFLSAVFAGLLFFVPIATFNVGEEIVKLSVLNFENQPNVLPLLILTILILIVPLVTIFLFKKRELQFKLSSLNTFLNALLCGLIFIFYVDKMQVNLSVEMATYAFGTYIPLINIVLSVLAMRWIRKDIELIKSVDRLR